MSDYPSHNKACSSTVDESKFNETLWRTMLFMVNDHLTTGQIKAGSIFVLHHAIETYMTLSHQFTQ